MISLRLFLWRMIVVSIGFIAAVAASIVVVVAGLGVFASAQQVVTTPDATGLLPLVVQTMRGATIAPVLATVVWPGWLIAGVLGEVVAARSLAVHLIGATVIAVAGVIGALPVAGPAHVQATAAAGLVAGFVYWLVAGHSAGVIRRTAGSVEGGPRSPHA